MYTTKITTVHLDSSERFDLDAPVEGSNQPRRPGTFRMQVREIEHRIVAAHWVAAANRESLYARGRRYKADGGLGSIDAVAPTTESVLPEPVLTALLEALEVLE